MRYCDIATSTRTVYLIGFTAQGFVRRHDGLDTPIHVSILNREVADAVLMEVAGGNDDYAAVEVIGTAITWGWGGSQGAEEAAACVLDSDIWVGSGRIDGMIRDVTIRIERVVGVDPQTGDTALWFG